MSNFQASNALCAVVQSLEGSSARMYADSNGNMTIGIGHFIEHPVDTKLEQITSTPTAEVIALTTDQIIQLFHLDLGETEWHVSQLLGDISLEQHQIDAIVSLAYNIGSGNFAGSTLLKRLLAGNLSECPDAILLWQGPTKLPGVLKRRLIEASIFNFPQVILDGYGLPENLENEALEILTSYRVELAAETPQE